MDYLKIPNIQVRKDTTDSTEIEEVCINKHPPKEVFVDVATNEHLSTLCSISHRSIPAHYDHSSSILHSGRIESSLAKEGRPPSVSSSVMTEDDDVIQNGRASSMLKSTMTGNCVIEHGRASSMFKSEAVGVNWTSASEAVSVKSIHGFESDSQSQGSQDMLCPSEGHGTGLINSERCCQIAMILIARALYIVHGLLVVWRVTVVLGNIMWLLALAAGGIIAELLFILIKHKGKETQWFQPAVVVYLLWIIPSIWLLEIDKLSRIQLRNNASHVLLGECLKITPDTSLFDDDDNNNGWWATIMSQTALVVLLICRWLIPRGNLTRDQLSIVLLYYLGTASDIVDFFNVLEEDEVVLQDLVFFFTVLTIWSWSLFQFVFNSTEPTPDEFRLNSISPDNKPAKRNSEKAKFHSCFAKFKQRAQQLTHGETWIIFGSMIMQDGPFAIVRLVTLFHWKIHTYTNFLFTLKNILMFTLQVYRIIVVYHHHIKEKRLLKEAARKRRDSMWKEALLKSTMLLSMYDPIKVKRDVISPVNAEDEKVDQTMLAYVLKNQHRVSIVPDMTDISV